MAFTLTTFTMKYRTGPKKSEDFIIFVQETLKFGQTIGHPDFKLQFVQTLFNK